MTEQMMCVKCSLEAGSAVFYKLTKMGVTVRYGYHRGKFRADLWECPSCHNRVIRGFGAEYFDMNDDVDYDLYEGHKGGDGNDREK